MAVYNDRRPVDFPYIAIKFKDTEEYIVSGENSCFISLSHKRKVEKANQISISVQFAPGSTRLYTSANKFEKNLVDHFSELTVEYGYVGKAHLYYDTLITDYTISMDNGILSYTLSGISEITASNYAPVNFKYPATADEERKLTLGDLVKKLNNLANEIYNKPLDTNINTNPWNKLSYRYEVVLDDNVDENQFIFDKVSMKAPIEASDTSLMGLIRAVLKKVNNLQSDPDRVSFLTVFIREDAKLSPKQIVIKQENFSINNGTNYTAKYDFFWNHRDANVINWNPSFSGKLAIFGFRNQAVSYVTPAGKPISYTPKVYADIIPQNLTEEETLQTQNTIDNWWAEMSRLPFKASLTVFGNPDMDCLLADYIKIQVYLGTDLHHTSGIYMILGITDNIDSNGFTTTYELLKQDALEDNEYVTYVTNSNRRRSSTSSTNVTVRTDGYVTPDVNKSRYRQNNSNNKKDIGGPDFGRVN